MKKTQKKIVATAVLGVVLLGGATQHQSIAVQATNVEANQRVSSSSGIVGTVGIVGVVSTPLFITATSQLSHRGDLRLSDRVTMISTAVVNGRIHVRDAQGRIGWVNRTALLVMQTR